MIRKIYASVVIALALAFALEAAIGFAAAVFVPKEFYMVVGNQPGFWTVTILTIVVPAFLVALLVMPALKFLVGSEFVKYAAIMAAVTLMLMLYRSDGWISSWMSAEVLIPNVLGALAIVVAAVVYKKLAGAL